MQQIIMRCRAALFVMCACLIFAAPVAAGPAKQHNITTGGHWLKIGFGVLIAFDKVNGHGPLQTHVGLDLPGVNSDSFAKFRQQFIDANSPYDVKQYWLTLNPQATQQTFLLRIKE